MSLDIKNLDESKILIVEDNAQNIEVLFKTLENESFQIAVATNGEKALNYIPDFLPDLILLDIMMPVMDGLETCERLKSNESTKEIPIIFLTAKAGSEDIVKGFELGAVDYITKPFRDVEVLARIRTHITLRQIANKNEQLIQELREAIFSFDEAQRENIAKSEFISRMSHELRTPMNAILGFSQLLEQNKEIEQNKGNRESVAEILKAGKHLLALINDVLEFSKVDVEQMLESLEKVSLFKIVNDVIASRAVLADSLKIKVINNIPRENEVKVDGDPKLLYQILDAFLINALKYNNEGRMVTIEETITKDGNITVSVLSTGDNIPEDMLEKVFEPFFRLESHMNSVNGIGLGLTLAKKHAELMDAAVSANNISNGCCFNLEIPSNK